MLLQIEFCPDACIIQQLKNRQRSLFILSNKTDSVISLLEELVVLSLLCLLTVALHCG